MREEFVGPRGGAHPEFTLLLPDLIPGALDSHFQGLPGPLAWLVLPRMNHATPVGILRPEAPKGQLLGEGQKTELGHIGW